jgi:hypothetical protein
MFGEGLDLFHRHSRRCRQFFVPQGMARAAVALEFAALNKSV